MVLHNIYSEQAEEAVQEAMNKVVRVAPKHLKSEGRELAKRTDNQSITQTLIRTVSTKQWKIYMKKLIEDCLRWTKKVYKVLKHLNWIAVVVDWLIYAFNAMTGLDIPYISSFGPGLQHDGDNVDFQPLTAPTAPQETGGLQMVLTDRNGRRFN
ncbi:hypothetical protein P875_00095220 [Aspergillus parasiticus SU-1]|uniref:Uncharacterized protein n=1 Tax=Aspergillus parasiticus (strain ATCC 56775 / NRRL 5862 / SRRC 143 / SU-1) TaxID=1403190 RepID=A0A0F0I4D6_ASPPU|nr:hypothetical protein P875_00095220 [Aspergillus parasiticus SU-1]